MESKTGKRIVSKGAYAKAKGVGLGLRASSKAFIALAICCVCFAAWMFAYFVCTILVFFMMWCSGRNDGTLPLTAIYFLLACGVSGAVSKGFAHLSFVSRMRAEAIENVVVLNRATTADLPLPDSLVRASEEPIQGQEAVLLHATTKNQETPPDQMVRAVHGQE